jgi:hypothetical protein
VLVRGRAGDQVLLDVLVNPGGIALERIAPAATTAGAYDCFGRRRSRNAGPGHRLELGLLGKPQEIAAGFARGAAPQAPGRTFQTTRLFEIPAALDHVAHTHVDAKAAAIFAVSAGIAP